MAENNADIRIVPRHDPCQGWWSVVSLSDASHLYMLDWLTSEEVGPGFVDSSTSLLTQILKIFTSVDCGFRFRDLTGL